MNLKVLKEKVRYITFADVPVGEVFAWKGEAYYYIKTKNENQILGLQSYTVISLRDSEKLDKPVDLYDSELRIQKIS